MAAPAAPAPVTAPDPAARPHASSAGVRGSLPPTGEPLYLVAGRALIAFRALRRAENHLARAQGACLLRLLDRRLHLRAGFARFTDFTRQVLQQAPRTTKRRVALHRTLAASSLLGQAFETARLTPCQVLALRPLAGHAALPFWIELAETIPVRDLDRRVRAVVARMKTSLERADADATACPRTGGIASDPDEEPGIRVTFAAPLAAAVAWDQGLEIARRVLGWDAPPHLCVEALLAEATAELAPDLSENAPGDAPSSTHPPNSSDPGATATATEPPPTCSPPGHPSPVSPHRRPRPRPGALRNLRSTLRRVERELRRVDRLVLPPPDDDPSTLIFQARKLGRLERPLRVLQARLLLAMLEADAVFALGHDSLVSFAEDALGLAPRTARRLLAQAILLQDEPIIAHAFTRGRIGAGQAFLVNRVALTATLPAFLRRAERVTHLALEREVRFLERLREILPTVARRFRGPLPMPGLEAALWAALADRGWGPDTVRARLRGRGVALETVPPVRMAPGVMEPRAGTGLEDPARNPAILRRLELLLEFVVLADADHDVRVALSPAGADGGSPAAEASGAGDAGVALDEAGAAAERPAGVPSLPGPTLASDSRTTTVTFWAPASLHRHWAACLEAIRVRCGPTPPWVAAIWITELAVRQWEHTDPARRPSEAVVLERDDYRCQAPGCSARRGLEVHHIRFRSQGGSDDARNLTTLCSTHHRRVVHAGWLRVAGRAPEGLVWDKRVS